MTDVREALIDALAGATPVYVALDDLPGMVGADEPESVWEALSGLLDEGEVCEWLASPVGDAVLLSERSASRLGLELQDGQGPASLRWVPLDAPGGQPDAPIEPWRPMPGRADVSQGPVTRPDPPKRGRPRGRGDWADFRSPDFTPPPKILTGSSIPCWTLAHESGQRPCIVCHDAPLDEVEACLGCLRWGGRHDPAEGVKPLPRDKRIVSDGLAGGVGTATAKPAPTRGLRGGLG